MGPSGEDDSPASAPAESGVAVEDTYNLHAPRLRRIAERKFNIPSPDAEGVVNEVFTAFLLRRSMVRDPGLWLTGAVCHASRAYWRSAARTDPMPSNVTEYVDPDSPGLETRIVDRVTMRDALNQVDSKCRETLRMYYAEGYSAREIAEQLNTTTNYVNQLLHICRKRVRKAYDDLREKRS
jgi:RNA polymerase sigma factor (sigma-70 family)